MDVLSGVAYGVGRDGDARFWFGKTERGWCVYEALSPVPVESAGAIRGVFDLRAIVDAPEWASIKPTVIHVAQARVKAVDPKAPRLWRSTGMWVPALLGKELCVLLWAVRGDEEATTRVRKAAVWAAMEPAERWYWYHAVADVGAHGVGLRAERAQRRVALRAFLLGNG